MLDIPGTGSHLYVTGVQPEWDTRENLALQCMFKTAANEDKALQADPTGISVSVENRGTDGQVRSESPGKPAERAARAHKQRRSVAEPVRP